MKKILSFLVSLGIGALSLAGCANASVSYRYEDAKLYSKGDATLGVPIDEIEIGWVSGSLTVEYYDGNTVSFSETSNEDLTDDNTLYYRVEGQKLMIQYMRSGARSDKDLKKELTVKIPMGKTLRELKLETVSADAKLRALHVGSCELETTSGVLEADFAEIDTVSVQTVSGDAVISLPTVRTIEFNSVSADITVRADAEAPRILDAESVSGDITLHIPRNSGFSLSLDTISGKFVSDFSYEKTNALYLVSGGTCAYDVETVSGDVNIRYLDGVQ